MSLGVLFNQTVLVERKTPSLDANFQIKQPTPATVKAAMKCAIEPLRSTEQNTILGRLPDAKRRLTCAGSEDLQDGDLVTWSGSRYVVAEPLFDNTRRIGAYITCILREGPSA